MHVKFDNQRKAKQSKLKNVFTSVNEQSISVFNKFVCNVYTIYILTE